VGHLPNLLDQRAVVAAAGRVATFRNLPHI
jgi:hypothetical protein